MGSTDPDFQFLSFFFFWTTSIFLWDFSVSNILGESFLPTEWEKNIKNKNKYPDRLTLLESPGVLRFELDRGVLL